MNKNIKIAKQLLKLAKELYGASGPQNKEKQDELIQQALQNQNYDVFMEPLINYKNNINNLLQEYGNRHEAELQALQDSFKKAKQQLAIIEENQKKGDELSSDTKKQISIYNSIIQKYNIASPKLPDLNSTADEIRVKLDRLMRAGKVYDIIQAMERLMARSIDISTCLTQWNDQFSDLLTPEGLFMKVIKTDKNGNQKGMIKSFIEAAEKRSRLKNAVQGATYIRNNLKTVIGNLEGELITYASVSNAYVQNIEQIARKLNNNLDKWQELMNDKHVKYIPEKKMWIKETLDSNGNIIENPILDLSKFQIPVRISSVKTAGIFDVIKNIFKTITEKAISLLKSIINAFNFTKKSQPELQKYNTDVKDEFEMFNQLIEIVLKN